MIRWNAAEVMQKCDEAEEILKAALPTIERAAAVLAEIKGIDNMPQYITSPVSSPVSGTAGRRPARTLTMSEARYQRKRWPSAGSRASLPALDWK